MPRRGVPFFISNKAINFLSLRCFNDFAYAAFQADSQKFLRFHGEPSATREDFLTKPFTTHRTASSVSIRAGCSRKSDLRRFRSRGFVLDFRVGLRTSMYGKVCAPHLSPITANRNCEKLRAFSAPGRIPPDARYELWLRPAEMLSRQSCWWCSCRC